MRTLRMHRAILLLPAAVLGACQTSGAAGRGQITGTAQLVSGAPASGASIVVEGSILVATADAKGSFTVDGVPPGTYALDITTAPTDAGSAISGLRVDNVTLPDNGQGYATGTNLGVLTLGTPGSIMGTVDLAGLSVKQVEAILTGLSQTDVTSGTFKIGNVFPGNYDLAIFAETPQGGVLTGGPIAVHVSSGLETKIGTVTLATQAVTLGNVQGQVRLAGLESSLGVTVQLLPPDGGPSLAQVQTSDRFGDYVFKSVPVGIETVSAAMNGFQTVAVPWVVVGATTSAPFIALSPLAVDAGP
jgi:hypothetical protein